METAYKGMPTGLCLIFYPCSNLPHLTRHCFAMPPKAFASANAGPASLTGVVPFRRASFGAPPRD